VTSGRADAQWRCSRIRPAQERRNTAPTKIERYAWMMSGQLLITTPRRMSKVFSRNASGPRFPIRKSVSTCRCFQKLTPIAPGCSTRRGRSGSERCLPAKAGSWWLPGRPPTTMGSTDCSPRLGNCRRDSFGTSTVRLSEDPLLRGAAEISISLELTRHSLKLLPGLGTLRSLASLTRHRSDLCTMERSRPPSIPVHWRNVDHVRQQHVIGRSQTRATGASRKTAHVPYP